MYKTDSKDTSNDNLYKKGSAMSVSNNLDNQNINSQNLDQHSLEAENTLTNSSINDMNVGSKAKNTEAEDAEIEDAALEADYDEDFEQDFDEEGFAEKAIASAQASDSLNEKNLEIKAEHLVSKGEAGQRIDKLAAEVFADHSRAQLQEWLKLGNLTVNAKAEKPKYRVKEGDQLLLQAKLEQHGSDQPEDIDLEVIYEDDSVLVINKPVGMVVHPGAGNWTGTLVNGLLYHYPNQAHLPRAGLVHRIDKNTSGLLVIGKTKAAQLELQEQLKDKTVYRHYQCIVAGDEASLTRQRVIDAPIGRHRTQRTKMTVTSVGKSAVTHIVGITPLNESYCLLDVQLETGRTHQIRVHLSHIGHPIIGDDVYGNRQQLRAGLTEEQREAIQKFPRQALHAYQLGFVHPDTGEDIEVTSELPEDMVKLAEILSE